jgi:hypothetical protein
MPANNALELTDINFDTIKSNLRNFLSNQTELGDYDYDSSTMQILLNLLAYNTYMNSYYLNMVGNEMFLDSAQIRSNVVSRAKMLGYTPRSAQGPTATVQLVVTPNDSPTNITVDKNTKFRTTIDGKQYIFVNPNAVTINANPSGIFSTNLDIVEGRPFTFKYTVSTNNPERYVIPAESVDTRSLTVSIQETAANSNITTYTNATNLTSVTGNTTAYFLQENEDGRYELKFGDNILGKALNDGNVVNIDYRVCNGSATAGANTFTAVDNIDGYSNITVNHVARAQGGGDRENIQSIKFNAPKNYENQNRAVTTKDYENIVKSQFSYIQSVSAWGGEDNNPPIYGKVYLSIKPTQSETLSIAQKNDITDFLQSKNIVTIEPVIVNPTYLYVKPEVTVKYNPNLTTATAGTLLTAVANKIISFENTQLGLFNKGFINSEFIKELDKVNSAFTSINSELRITKRFVPDTTTVKTYTLNFNRSLLNITGGVILRINPAAHPGRGLTATSSTFTYKGISGTRLDDDGFGNLRTYYVDTSGVRVYTNRIAGTINYNTGLIQLNNLLITAYTGSGIEITVDPDANDVDLIRNQIILIKDAKVNIYDNNLKKIVATTSNISTQGETTSITEDAIISTVY